jgi:hypothetical protein
MKKNKINESLKRILKFFIVLLGIFLIWIIVMFWRIKIILSYENKNNCRFTDLFWLYYCVPNIEIEKPHYDRVCDDSGCKSLF